MEIKYLTAGRNWTPITVVGDHDYVTRHIWSSDGSSVDYHAEDVDEIDLDPGGMLASQFPFAYFSIDQVKFRVQHTKIGWALSNIKNGKERVPGYIRFAMWHWHIVVPIGLHKKLIAKLEELLTSDAELAAGMDEYELLRSLNSHPSVNFNKMPKENPGAGPL